MRMEMTIQLEVEKNLSETVQNARGGRGEWA